MDTIQLIDTRIRALEIELAALRARRNALFSPFRRLPTELIVKILKCVQVQDYMPRTICLDPLDDFFPPQPTDYGRNWVHLMATCKHWRATALATSQLWQCIEARANSAWRELCIERASGLPPILYAYPNLRRPRERNISDITITQLPRSVSAYISWLNTMALTIPDTIKCPSLRHLILELGYAISADSFLEGKFMSLTLLDLNIPKLNVWPECPNLQHLRLQCNRIEPGLTGEKFLKWLDHMQQLEIASLTFSSGASFNDPTGYVATGNLLPALKVLTLYCSMDTSWTTMLRALLVSGPSTALRVKIDLDHLILPPDALVRTAYQTLVETVNQWWNDRSLKPIRCKVTYSNRSGPNLALTSHSFSRYESIKLNNAKPTCAFDGPYLRDAFSVYSSVGVMQLGGDRVGPTTTTDGEGDPDPEGIELMDHLDAVIVRDVKTIVHVNLLGKWMSKRKATGRGIRLLKVVSTATDKAKAALETLSARLIKQGVIDAVEWSKQRCDGD